VADSVRDLARDRRIERLPFLDRRLELLRRVLAQVCPDGLFAEHIGSEVRRFLGLFCHFWFPFSGLA
jgi:hypothetical protein